MVTSFHDMMHKEIEVYVDDMIAKPRTEKEHVQVLRKLFLRLRKFQLKLNPAKCTFGARSGKLLGFVVSEKGIEIGPDKDACLANMMSQEGKKERYTTLVRSSLNVRQDTLYVNQKTIKGSAIANFLANRALDDYEPLNFDFPNEDLMHVATTEKDAQDGHPWKLNSDGALNVMGNGIGAVLISTNGYHFPFTSKLDFDCTNNMAEYEACIIGECETRDPKLIEYKKLVLELIKEFDDITFCYLPRNENQMADALAALAFMATENDKRTLRRLANDYVLDGEILYKRRKDHVLLRCVDAVAAKKILEEVHKGICGTHANGFTMARQIMIFGIISDNALNLNNNTIAEFYSQFKIKHHNLSPYRPKMNGVVEAANKNIKKIVGKMTETYKDWHEKLPFSLYAYRMFVKTSTKATPFSLVCKMEAVLLIEVEIPSLRVLSELKLDEVEWIQS
ncbi:Integrase, catalytic core [Gossypium australe]|uniref:Integrase, catalytic core n=1 Tax=Gossypium australe TaxID=47621 RepID=A0A5B6VJV7_9ROSI|nr:Integrase, catalytic core [Gossypium australe]